MKLFDIKKILSQKIAEMLAEGYVLVDDDSSFGCIARYDLMKEGEPFKYRVWLERIYESYKQLTDIITLNIARMPVEETFISEKHGAVVEELRRFYAISREKDYWTESEEDAHTAAEISLQRYMNRRPGSAMQIRPTAKLAVLMKKYKGFGKCNVNTLTVTRRGGEYVVSTVFAGRQHVKVFQVGK